MGPKKDRNKAEMQERKKSTRHLQKIHSRCRVHTLYSLLVFFHVCLVSVLFSGPFQTEMKFYRNFFPSLCSFSAFFFKTTFQIENECLLYWKQTLLAWEMNTFCASDECLSAGNERVENTRSNFTHTQTASYEWLSNRTYLEMIATHRYSPPSKWEVATTLSYSPLSTLHPQVTYAIAFYAGLNGLQVD